MAVRQALLLALMTVMIGLAGCATFHTPAVAQRIALLAPFEGRYREVGYEVFYAARLAVRDAGGDLELLALDDGGTAQTAHERARALVSLPGVRAVLVAGHSATDTAVLTELAAHLPVFVVGHWGAEPVSERVYILAHAALASAYSVPARLGVHEAETAPAPLTGGEVFALAQLPRLRADLDGVTVVTSAALPDAAFAERYRASDLFVPEPGILALLAYDITALLAAQPGDGLDADALHARLTRPDDPDAIRFADGYWAGAPINRYGYRAGALAPLD